MKRCPSCQRTYTDDTLRFCLEDGATLLSSGASGSSDPMAATLLDSPPRNTGGDSSRSAPTEVLQSPQTSNNQASPTRSWGTPNVAQPPPNSWDAARRYSGQKSAPLVSTPPARQTQQQQRSWPGVVSLIIGIITWLAIALSFIGAGFKVRSELIGVLFLAGMFIGIFGVVFGAVAFGIAFKNPDRFGGKGFALIGFFMSLMPTLFLLLLIAIGIAVTTK